MTNVATVEQTDVLEERIIDAEYKIWKKNTPYLYDFVMTHSQEWPSLTCQWLPTVRNIGKEVAEHNLLIGTHTNGEQNYLMVASCSLPRENTLEVEKDAKKDDSAAAKKPPPQYDEEKKEVGGYGLAHSTVGKLEIKMKIKHEGEVNRARYMPSNHFIVASRGPSPEIYIFDVSKHPSFPADGTPFSPQAVCVGHTKEGYALEWSQKRAGILLSGSEDTTVKLWDVNAAATGKSEPGTQMKAVSTFSGHTKMVEDVDWHSKDENMFGSVGDDSIVNIWDSRKPEGAIHSIKDAHDGDINSIAFNPVQEHLFATGSADKTIKLWDMRNLNKCLETFRGHTDQVYKVEWAPFNESILASCSDDRRIGVWDLSRIGMEQSPEDAEDGPPELLFLHGGHTSKVSDFSWNKNDDWTIASVSEDNVMQVWNMAEEIYKLEGDDDEDNGEGEDGLLQDDELEG